MVIGTHPSFHVATEDPFQESWEEMIEGLIQNGNVAVCASTSATPAGAKVSYFC